MCFENLRLGSIRTPRSLTTSDFEIRFRGKLYLCSGLVLPRWIVEHFEKEIGSCQSNDQLCILLSWRCRLAEEDIVMLVYSLRSSAKSLAITAFSIESVISFMKIVNRRGPRTLP